MACILETMGALRTNDAIDKQSMDRSNEECLNSPHTISPGEIKAIREGARLRRVRPDVPVAR